MQSVSIVDAYENLDLIGKARSDFVIYDLPPHHTGKRGRPALHGKKLSIQNDFMLSGEKIGDCYMGVRRVLTNIFGKREVLAYVTSPESCCHTRMKCFQNIVRKVCRNFGLP